MHKYITYVYILKFVLNFSPVRSHYHKINMGL
jgi:hypothetical protein